MTTPDCQVVILAAGKGSRLGPLTETCPKPLTPVDNNTPLLLRTIEQLISNNFKSIKVVVGYQHNKIIEALVKYKKNIQFIVNDEFDKDDNSLSLWLGLQQTNTNVLILEGDVVFSDEAFTKISSVCEKGISTWFSYGPFLPHQMGGIIKSNEEGYIQDILLVKKFDQRYKSYSKNLGVMFLNLKYKTNFIKLLNDSIQKKSYKHYLKIWLENKQQFNILECDLGSSNASSFNTLEELKYSRERLNVSNIDLKGTAL